MQQRLDLGRDLAQIKLVEGREAAHTAGQFMVLADLDFERLDLRMTGESGPQEGHEFGRLVGRLDLAGGVEAEDRIGAVKREPAAPAFEEAGQGGDLFRFGQQVAGVGDEEVRGLQPRDVRKVHRHRRSDFGQFGEQLQQLQPREIDVVIFARGDQVDLHGSRPAPTRARLG